MSKERVNLDKTRVTPYQNGSESRLRSRQPQQWSGLIGDQQRCFLLRKSRIDQTRLPWFNHLMKTHRPPPDRTMLNAFFKISRFASCR
jgi:hypothetical protein